MKEYQLFFLFFSDVLRISLEKKKKSEYTRFDHSKEKKKKRQNICLPVLTSVLDSSISAKIEQNKIIPQHTFSNRINIH